MENSIKQRDIRRKRRSLRVRKNVRGTLAKPRLTVFRSNKHLLAQIIDDENHVTLFGIGTMSKELDGAKKSKDAARQIGKRIAIEAKKKNIENVVFDRGHYKYHGIIAELANAAREEGLKF
ncbi:MAG: 50S ribosomal protein L18 [Verrucomicrobia bacterium]|nr:50S ribosomal protein L18 [Verrucomicrobiota bacterium]